VVELFVVNKDADRLAELLALNGENAGPP